MQERRKLTMDGNTAAAYVSYAFTETAAIYPITPSSTMAEMVDEWSAQGRRNIFGHPVEVREMQSEGGAAGAMHGCLQSGALASTYTASQGLLLMLPNMYKIAGELLPGVFHVSARSLASNALSIFGDHQDVMSARQTGAVLLASSGVQQCMDLGAVAHLAAIKGRLPVLHFFDGFRTSHELQKIEVLEYDELAELTDMEAVRAFRRRALCPGHPVLRGTTQNPDVFFQTREAVNPFYDRMPSVVQGCMDDISRLTGREYRLFQYHGAPDAEHVLIAMGSACEVILESVEYLNARGKKLGLLEVHLYRPFSAEHLLAAIPASARRICVLDRTKEPGAAEPLCLDVRNAYCGKKNAPLVIGGRYGLASKDFGPQDVAAVVKNLESAAPVDGFTVGITDDVTHKSLPLPAIDYNPAPESTTACKFWGLGSDGTVSANKSAVKIIGDELPVHAQAYFAYDSKKSGGLTISHLRFGKTPIRSSYCIKQADFVACHNQSYVGLYDMLEDVKPGGVFLLNCIWPESELEERLPAFFKRTVAEKNIRFYILNAVEIAKGLGLGSRINMIMQAAFFSLTGILPEQTVVESLTGEIRHNYGRQGEEVVRKNVQAVLAGMSSPVRVNVPGSWKEAAEEAAPESGLPAFVREILIPMNRQRGDLLPVSAFSGNEDGTYPTGTTRYEKRGVAIEIPYWDKEACIQCNQCSFVCPHAVIRPTLLDKAAQENAPAGFPTAPAKGFDGKAYHLAISPLDCTGCGNCADICPAGRKALRLRQYAHEAGTLSGWWAYAEGIDSAPAVADKPLNVKNSQFLRPLFEFSGACAGCGETPYAKLVTQLFGDRMVVSNSAGCCTVWGGCAPAIAYCKDKKGRGPAWGFSLFEDNAEYGLGLLLGARVVREGLVADVGELLPGLDAASEAAIALRDWLSGFGEAEGTWERAEKLEKALAPHKDDPLFAGIWARKDYFVKRSQWVFGGDGWAYDIGYGGLDHVLSTGEDLNLLVLDTEVYSNTGGQASKSTPLGAVAKFAAAGKSRGKKDLGLMAMSYGNVYVAQIAMGADKGQALRAITEAEAYPGPSLILAYAPCVNHGIRGGMGKAQEQQRRAVAAGYWSLYRYNPLLREEGRNPFTLDSGEPTESFRDFLMSEVRYSSLQGQNPAQAEALFLEAERDARRRRTVYRNLSRLAPDMEPEPAHK